MLAENLVYPVLIFILHNTNLCPLRKIPFSEPEEIHLLPVILCTWIFSCELVKEKKPAFILNYKSNLGGEGSLINQRERTLRWSDRKHPRLEIKQMISGDPSPRGLDHNPSVSNHMGEVIPPTHGGTQMPVNLESWTQTSMRAEGEQTSLYPNVQLGNSSSCHSLVGFLH